MRPVWPGRPNPRGATFDGARRQLRGLLAGRDPRRGLPLRRRRSRRARSTASICPRPPDHVLHGYVPGLAAGHALRPARARPLRARARAPLQPEQAARRSVRQGALGRGRLDAAGARLQAGRGRRRAGRPDDRPARQRRRACRRAWSSTIASTGATTGRPRSPWRETIIYEAHVRGFTKLHPEVPGAAARHLRGPGPSRRPSSTSRSWASPRSSCCPFTSSPTTASSRIRSLRNYWGYSTLGFFAPEQRYAERPAARRAGRASSRRWSRRCTPRASR